MISLVTACMNRDAHLRRSLPVWLGLPNIAEVLVLDWSNRTPLYELEKLDSRVRVVRVEGEPRWILSYAYNLGISQAKHDLILKCDADCLPTAEVTQLRPDEKFFYAGHWKTGTACGKPSVNGQCFFTRAQFEHVNGYSEVIRMYGRDDEDFYDRLVAAGFGRAEIPAANLSFIEHTKEERLVNQVGTQPTDIVEAFLRRQPTYFEMYNFALAKLMPWGLWNARARFTAVGNEGAARLQRDLTREIPIVAPIHALARVHALRSVVMPACKLSAPQVMAMDEKACVSLLREKLTAIQSQRRAPVTAISA